MSNIILSVLRISASDYPFSILNLFLMLDRTGFIGSCTPKSYSIVATMGVYDV